MAVNNPEYLCVIVLSSTQPCLAVKNRVYLLCTLVFFTMSIE